LAKGRWGNVAIQLIVIAACGYGGSAFEGLQFGIERPTLIHEMLLARDFVDATAIKWRAK
jgi:hypothetical protein